MFDFTPKKNVQMTSTPLSPQTCGGMAVKMVLNTMKWWLKGAYNYKNDGNRTQIIKKLYFQAFRDPKMFST